MLSESDHAALPVAVAEARGWLRISDTAEDGAIERLILTAAAYCEQFIDQALIMRTVHETVQPGADWRRLARRPVRSITAVERLGPDGTASAVAAGAYAIDIDADGDGWVRLHQSGGGPIRVTYQAGIGAAADAIPPPLRQGMLRLVAHLHAHRDAADDGGPPAAVAALWRPFRRMRLA